MESKNNKGSGDLKDWLKGLKKQKEDDSPPAEEKEALIENKLESEEEIQPKVECKKDVEKEKEEKRDNKSENVLLKDLYAHFLLIDIGGPIKEIRGTPRYIQIEKTKTLIGRYMKANIHLDDPNTIEPKHAKLVYEDIAGDFAFIICPIGSASLTVNGEIVLSEGIPLKSGDIVEMGSAKLIFFQKDIGRG